MVQAYKFASNEYRVFPLRFQIGFCVAFNKNIGGFGDFTKCRNFDGCPIKKVKFIFQMYKFNLNIVFCRNKNTEFVILLQTKQNFLLSFQMESIW